jgi:spectinomycin phosphotransferase
MRALPTGLEDDDVRGAIAGAWDLDVARLTYFPEGGGSYHWLADTGAGQRYFVTVDDLDNKPWLGTHRDVAFEGLRAAYDTALILREKAHRTFVVAPIRANDGASLRHVGSQYSVALFPFVDGQAGTFGETPGPAERTRVLHLLAQLHQSTEAVLRAPRREWALPGRADLEAALGDVDRPWSAGPFAEPARNALARKAEDIAQWLAAFDDLTAHVESADPHLVVTHGEPHSANLMRVEGELFLIDWDTVGLAPPERDLWMLDDGFPDGLRPYVEATGHAVDEAAISLYRLTWTLADVAAYTALLRAPHDDTADTAKGMAALTTYLG